MYFHRKSTCCALNLLSLPMQAKQNGGAFKDNGWAMYTYTYFTLEAQVNISSIGLYEIA